MNAGLFRYENESRQARKNPVLSKAGYILACVFMTLGVLDAISTNWALEVGAYEKNAFMRWLQNHLGPLWFIPKMLLQALVATMIIWSPNKPTIMIMVLTSCWTASVVVSNFTIIYVMS